MNARVTLVLALLGYGVSFLSMAQDDWCSGSGYMEGAECIGNKNEVAEQEMEQAFQDAITRARKEDKYRLESGFQNIYESSLVESQRAWLEYVHIDCELAGIASGAGGGWAGVHAEECVLNNIKKRTVALKGLWAG